MEVLESAEERYDRLLLAGILRFADDGIAQWCFACRRFLVHPLPTRVSHAVIDRLADVYAEHTATCFLERHGQRL
jgi:hypothetical protein